MSAVPADDLHALLPPAPVTTQFAAARGALSERQAAGLAPVSADAEVLAAQALPTPGSAPMEATLYLVPTPKPTPTPAPVARAAPQSNPEPIADGSVWDRLAHCESTGNWSINTGNGYYGGLQFNYSTWQAYGGGEFAEYAHQATREQQITVAERLHAARGFQPWPACRVKLGLP